MRLRPLLALLVVAALAISAAPALAHDTGESVHPDETEPIERQSDNVELLSHHFFAEGSDMMFQQREGRQVLEGEIIDDTRDYAFVGGDAKHTTDFGAMQIFDVTDPSLPQHLADIPCSGYHAEVGVYENLMFQGIDSSGTNQGCEDPETWDPDGLDRSGQGGIRVFDVTDPANPVVAGFIGAPWVAAVHNFTVNPEDGLLYLSYSGGGELGVVDLESRDEDGERTFETTNLDLEEDIGVPGEQVVGDCHDIGLNLERDLMACAASISGQTYIWDMSDPRLPQQLSTIVAPEVVHHGARWAPDGTTLVLNDEFAGALDLTCCDPTPQDIGVGSNGCLGPNGVVGALWFFDTTDAASPTPMGSFTPTFPQPQDSPCTSHFYNFIPGTTKVVVGWYEAGIVVADYGLAPIILQDAVFLPELGNFWSAYYFDGTIYGASRTVAGKGYGGGLWAIGLEGVDASNGVANPHDEGTSWARWTSQVPTETPEDADIREAGTGSGVVSLRSLLGNLYTAVVSGLT